MKEVYFATDWQEYMIHFHMATWEEHTKAPNGELMGLFTCIKVSREVAGKGPAR